MSPTVRDISTHTKSYKFKFRGRSHLLENPSFLASSTECSFSSNIWFLALITRKLSRDQNKYLSEMWIFSVFVRQKMLQPSPSTTLTRRERFKLSVRL